MTHIYLVRHAEAEGNLYRRIHGHYDSRVTAQGLLQLERLRERFMEVPLDAVYSSDLNRTRLTAGAVAFGSGVPVGTDPQLREIYMGVWEDKTWGDVIRDELDEYVKFSSYTYDWQIENCESFAHAQNRLLTAVLEIAAANEGKTVAVVSHGCVIRSLMCYLDGITHDVFEMPYGDNTNVSLLTVEGGKIDLVYRYDASHLPDTLSRFRRQKWRTNKFGLDSYALRFAPWDGDIGLDYIPTGEAWAAIREDTPVGLVELDWDKDAEIGLGHIKYYAMLPEHRGERLSVQLLGQAVSRYRAAGRRGLAVNLSDHPDLAGYFEHFGFVRRDDGLHLLDIAVNQAK